MIDSTEILKRLYIWGVTAFAVVPRQHIDRNRCSVGGKLSRSFKLLLLVLVAFNATRFSISWGRTYTFLALKVFSDVLGVIEVLGLTFLSFLTPYILQTQLVDRINIGGRPGANLTVPLYLTAFLAITGVILSRNVDPRFWCVKKWANAISSPPVIRTLKMYNSVTTVGGLHHNGRGTVFAQTLMTVEYWHIITQLLCSIGYAFERSISQEEYNQWDHMLFAFREVSFVSDWTRVCMHALFINLLDEIFLSSPWEPSTRATHSAEDGGDDKDVETSTVTSFRNPVVPLEIWH